MITESTVALAEKIACGVREGQFRRDHGEDVKLFRKVTFTESIDSTGSVQLEGVTQSFQLPEGLPISDADALKLLRDCCGTNLENISFPKIGLLGEYPCPAELAEAFRYWPERLISSER